MGSLHTCDRNATESEPSLDVQDILDGISGREDDRVADKTVFVTLYSSNHGRLTLCTLVMVNDTNPSQKLEVKKMSQKHEMCTETSNNVQRARWPSLTQ